MVDRTLLGAGRAGAGRAAGCQPHHGRGAAAPRPRRCRLRPRLPRGGRARVTTRCCSATWSAACDRILAAIEAGERICVHGDYDADGICATALAVLVLRSLGAEVGWHLPSRFEEGYGVGAQALERLAGEGVRLVRHGRLRHHRSRRGGASPRARHGRDRDRPPPPCRAAARLPAGLHAAVGVPVPGAVRHRRGAEAGRGAVRPQPDASATSSISTSTWWRWPPWPTWCRCWTRTAGWCGPACAAWRAPPSRGCGR